MLCRSGRTLGIFFWGGDINTDFEKNAKIKFFTLYRANFFFGGGGGPPTNVLPGGKATAALYKVIKAFYNLFI